MCEVISLTTLSLFPRGYTRTDVKIIIYISSFFTSGKMCDKPLLRKTSISPVYSGSGDLQNGYANAGIKSNGWCASGPDSYLLLDLKKEYHITEVVVMGDKEQTKWSNSYSFKYSHDSITYKKSQVSKTEIGCTGNGERHRIGGA